MTNHNKIDYTVNPPELKGYTVSVKKTGGSDPRARLVGEGKYVITYTAIPDKPEPKPTPTPGRTCQDDGYPVGYYWSDEKQACIIDNVPKKVPVPNTANK